MVRATHAQEEALADRQWFAIVALVFTAAIAACFGVVWLFHVTGPHPEIWTFLHKLHTAARWLLPRWSHHWRAT